MSEEEKDPKVNEVYDNLKKKIKMRQAEGMAAVSPEIQALGGAVEGAFLPFFAKLEAKIEERFELYDEGIDRANKNAMAARKAVEDAKKEVMTAIRTTAWIVGILSVLVGLVSALTRL